MLGNTEYGPIKALRWSAKVGAVVVVGTATVIGVITGLLVIAGALQGQNPIDAQIDADVWPDPLPDDLKGTIVKWDRYLDQQLQEP